MIGLTYTVLNWINIFDFVECNAGYHGSGRTCTLCSGNTIKPDQGDAPSCDTECDTESSEPNTERTQCSKCTCVENFNSFL